MTQVTSTILAIDPGSEKSAAVIYCMKTDTVETFLTRSNTELLSWLVMARNKSFALVVEKIVSFGFAVKDEMFETAWWGGRFAQAWGPNFEMYSRRQVRKTLFGQDKAKGSDARIRAFVIDHFGGKSKAIGKKLNPGRLFYMREHEWQACGLALAYAREINNG